MKKNVIIDRLRGLSVLVVVCMHTLLFFPNVLMFLGDAIGNGYYGVTAFFCTSGFLITANLLRRHGRVADVDFYAFYVMRFGRIVPPLALLLAVLAWLSTTSIEAFHFVGPVTLKDTVVNVLTLRYNHYYQSAGSQTAASSILWSLSIKEMFYLAYPVTAKLARRTTVLVAVLLAVVVAAIWHRRGGLNTIYDYFGCFDGIALGALAALAANRVGRSVHRPAAWAVMLSGIALVGGTYATLGVDEHHNFGLLLIGSGTALILFASQCALFADTRRSPYDPLAYLGRLSYEIYLSHMVIFALLGGVAVPHYPALMVAVALLCVVIVSDALARFYAEPLNRLLRILLLPSRPTRVAATSLVPPAVG